MPVTERVPEKLRPYHHHGVRFTSEGSGHAMPEDCPLCRRGGHKFSVNLTTGLWDCKKCGASGNPLTFVRQLYDLAMAGGTTDDDYEKLRADRKLMKANTLKAWGLVKSPLTGEWLVPGHGLDGEVEQLWRYVKCWDGERKRHYMKLIPTPGLWPEGKALRLHGLNLWDPSKPEVCLCEGPWDGMALWEVLRCTKLSDGKFAVTGSETSSLAASVNVVAQPGANVFSESWSKLFTGKTTALLYDSDHPRENPPGSGRTTTAGWDGARRTAGILAASSEPPETIKVLTWGPEGYDLGRPSGYDVRDALSGGLETVGSRIERLAELLAAVQPIPGDWAAGRTLKARRTGGTEVELLPCKDWRTLVTAWRKALSWTDGHDVTLSCVLATVLSTSMQGDQLWLQVISPPSTGKTVFAEAVGLAHDYVKSVGNFTGFHSGWKDGSGEDYSLLATLKGKTFIVKDGDTLLRSANRDSILAEARDAYDTNCAVHYRNAVNRVYAGHRFTFILCGTPNIHELDAAEAGARYLRVSIMNSIDPAMEAGINEKKFWEVMRNRHVEANGDMTTHTDASLQVARRLTAGYVVHLRQNTGELLARVSDTNAGELQPTINAMAQFISFARARPSKTQTEEAVREMSPRLTVQLSKLALCLAAVMNKTEVDAEVVRRVRKVVFDTSHGRTLKLIRALHEYGEEGAEAATLAARTHEAVEGERKFLHFLKKLKAVDIEKREAAVGVAPARVWKLTPRMAELYRTVTTGE